MWQTNYLKFFLPDKISKIFSELSNADILNTRTSWATGTLSLVPHYAWWWQNNQKLDNMFAEE